MFALHIEGVSRSLLIVFAVLCTCFLAAIRILIQNSLRRAWKQGKNCKNILVVGTGPRAVAFAQRLEKYKEWGYRITGFIDEEVQNGRIQQYPVTQGLEKLPSLLRNEVVDIVAFVVPRSWLERIGSYIRQCELLGKDVAIQVDLYDHSIGHVHLADMAGLPVLQFETAVREGWQVIIKRWVDILVSGILIVLLSPLLLFIALLIKKVSPGGPVFYRQIRCGMNGRTFQLLKFRSMVPNADKMQKELAHLNESSGPVFKITKDPRLIPYGGFLRKFSLDELPQLFNVFKGDMSLVGPRPPIPHEVEEYDDWQRRKLSVRPGITCLWQVSGRNKISFEDWMRLDLQYIDSWSLWLDLKILLRTIPVVIAGTGK
jgi:exopolysaccharide biosynthesis polyprenyl glycosylphosphotransferase